MNQNCLKSILKDNKRIKNEKIESRSLIDVYINKECKI